MMISTTNPLLAILEASRRDFLRRTGGTVAAAATKGPMGALKSVVGGALKNAGGVGGIIDKLSHLSDEELSETPEQDWINIIPSERLAKMVKSGSYDISNEFVNKAHTVLTYGPDNKQSGSTIQLMLKSLAKSGINPAQAVSSAFTSRKSSWFWEIFGNASGKDISAIPEIEEAFGMRFGPVAEKQMLAREREYGHNSPDNQYREEDREEPEQSTEPEQSKQSKQSRDRYDDMALANPMHQHFEGRLATELNRIFG